MGQSQAATQEENLIQATKLNPNNAEAYYRLGLHYQSTNKHALAVKEFREALKVNPNYAEAYFALGISLAHLGEYKQAIEKYRKAAEYDPNYCAQAYNGIGSAYRDMHEKEYLKQALDSFVWAADRCVNKEDQLFVISIQNIVTTYMALYEETVSAGKNGRDNLLAAINYAQKTSSFKYKQEYPKYYAMIQYCLGELYSQLGGEENAAKAESAFKEALSIFNRSQYPNEHQMVIDSLRSLKPKQSYDDLTLKTPQETDNVRRDKIIQLVDEADKPLRGAMVSLYEKKDGEFIRAYFRDKAVNNLGQLEVSSTLLDLPKSSELFIHTQDGFYWQTIKMENLKFTGQTAKISLAKTGIISATITKVPQEINRYPVVVSVSKRGEDGSYKYFTGIGIFAAVGYPFEIYGLPSGTYKIQIKKSYDSGNSYYENEKIEVETGRKTNIGNLELR